MSENYTPITHKGKVKLENELSNLIKVEREKIKLDLEEARALGDLKENAEYHSAKERQSLVEGRIKELQFKIAHSRVIDISLLNGPVIKFGATVTLYDTQKERSITYQIVGQDEANTKQNKIPFNAPLAKALIGKSEGDTIEVDAPKGKLEFDIEKVEYIE